MKSPNCLTVENHAEGFRRKSLSANAIIITTADRIDETKQRSKEVKPDENDNNNNIPSQVTPTDEIITSKRPASALKTLTRSKEIFWKKRHKDLRINIFLSFCVFLTVLFSALFSILGVPADPYEYRITSYAVVWPLKNNFLMTQTNGAQMEVFWGDTKPALSQAPTVCQDRKAWCYMWPGNSYVQLTITEIPLQNGGEIDCVVFQWRRAMTDSETRVEFISRFSSEPKSETYFYGGPVGTNAGWPISGGPLTSGQYAPLFTVDAQSGSSGMYGVQEPFWVLNSGMAIVVNRIYQIEVNQSDSEISIRSADPYTRGLQYAVCRGSSAQTLIMQMQNIRKMIFNEQVNKRDSKLIRKINESEYISNYMCVMVDLDCRNLNTINVTQVVETLNLYNLSFVIMFENFDFFDAKMSTDLTSLLNSTGLASFYPTSVEANNFVKTNYINDDIIKGIEMCVLQEAESQMLGNPNPIGTVLWRGLLYFVIDFTRAETRRMFFHAVESHPIQNYVQFLAFTGGTAAQLPVRPLLNVSENNLNFYSYEFAESVGAALANSLSISAGYGNQNLTNLNIDVPVRLENVSSIIPLFLTLNILGYSNLILHLFQPAGITDIETLKSDDPLLINAIRYFELAMFLPKFRLPYEIMQTKVFREIYERLHFTRNRVISPHYVKAEREWRQSGIPILRPVWWPDDGDSLSSEAWSIDNQFMIGNDLVVAAFLVSHVMPEVYLPAGVWRQHNRTDSSCYSGGGITVLQYRVDIVCFERVINPSNCAFNTSAN